MPAPRPDVINDGRTVMNVPKGKNNSMKKEQAALFLSIFMRRQRRRIKFKDRHFEANRVLITQKMTFVKMAVVPRELGGRECGSGLAIDKPLRTGRSSTRSGQCEKSNVELAPPSNRERSCGQARDHHQRGPVIPSSHYTTGSVKTSRDRT
ncbi:hypothetical protein J6590_063986 [Homalodisca vitripennis]|nr:hypothetical protein J6590_063986 [Homalodisca vitripennis]